MPASWEDVRNGQILVVDDDEANLRLIEQRLARAGYRHIELISDPRRVVPRVREREPDLILLDLAMPYLNGFEVLEQLKEILPEDTYLPVIVITGHLDDTSILRALVAGAKDFQVKPLDFVELLLRVRSQIETRLTLRALREGMLRHDAYLRTVIHAIPDVLLAQDAEGRIRMANQATAEVLGGSLDSIVGHLHREVTQREEDVAELEEQIRGVLSSGEGNVAERSVLHPITGKAMWFETRVVPLFPPDGGPTQALVVATDFTARKAAEAALRNAQMETLARLARAAEYRDDDTGKHTRRVGKLAAEIARLMGLPPEEVDLIGQAAPLHDIGKIGIPDSILLKPSRLTPAEYEIVKRHTEIGGDILAGGSSELIVMAEEIARAHHERWDGSGYPNQLQEDECAVPARIVTVADVADALSHDRPYRKAWPKERVIGELRNGRGSAFDGECVDACLEIITSQEEWIRWAEA